jgi:hypothetical protein
MLHFQYVPAPTPALIHPLAGLLHIIRVRGRKKEEMPAGHRNPILAENRRAALRKLVAPHISVFWVILTKAR